MTAQHYVLSERAAAALRPLLQPGSAYGSRPRPVREAPTADGAPPRPFAARIEGATGSQTLAVYLPPRTALDVSWGGAPLSPAIQLGTEAEPWRSLGSWTPDQRLWILVTPPGRYGEGDAARQFGGEWTLVLAAAPPVVDGSGRTALAFPVAAWEGARGLVQHHLGILALNGDEVDESADPPPNPCGHPLNNNDDDNDVNPLDWPNYGSSSGAVNTSTTGHPLDGEGEGGFTPACREDIAAALANGDN